jgi:hypothetical protein
MDTGRLNPGDENVNNCSNIQMVSAHTMHNFASGALVFTLLTEAGLTSHLVSTKDKAL